MDAGTHRPGRRPERTPCRGGQRPAAHAQPAQASERYNCYGITYNKTLLKKYGWELPNSFAELEELAAKAKEAGVNLCLPQIQYPGYGFQYLCNIADADFLGTLDGRLWQRDYLSGKANVSNTPGMMQAMAYVQKWKDIGMLNDTGDALDDNVTRQRMAAWPTAIRSASSTPWRSQPR